MPAQEIIPRSELPDPVWLEKRRSGVGGSQLAAILGLVPGEFDVWASITQGVQAPDNAAMRGGRFLEDGIARWYAHLYGRHLLPSVFARHPSEPHMIGTPDGFLAADDSPIPFAGLEIKRVSRFMAGEWGEPGTDQVPVRCTLQCCHYMAIFDLDVWYVSPLIEGEPEPLEYIVNRDRELEALIAARITAWWIEHIINGVEPDRSTARHMDEYIAARFPRETEPLRDATEAEIPLLEALRYGTRVKKAVENRVEALTSALKLSIGNAAGIDWNGTRIPFKATKAYTRKACEVKAGRRLYVPQKWGRALPAPERKELPDAGL